MKPMLAHTYDGRTVTGWLVSEKLDGIRGLWDGARLVSREGNPVNAPAWFLAGLPAGVPLDGELWMGRGTYGQMLSAFQRHQPRDNEWQRVQFVAFDSPGPEPAEERLARASAATVGSPVASAVCLHRIEAADALWTEYARVKAAGGEGLMLRRPGSRYEERRSWALLKVKAGEGA